MTAAGSSASASGEVLADRYRLIRRLGSGGMGAVWEAQHTVVDRRFAIKFLLPQLSESEDARRRFEREARAAGGIESEHVVAVVDYGVAASGEPFIVMEYLRGEDLATLLERETQLALPRAVALVLQAARGIAKAHARGIVHRDVKPKNLFVTRREDGVETCKVLDFGVAKLAQPTSGISTKTGDLIGTLEYMAPEQVRGDPNVDARADVYALGCVLYEALAGRRPYLGPEAHVVMYRILEGKLAPLAEVRPGLPREISDIVGRAMQPEASARYDSAAQLVAALAAFTNAGKAAVSGDASTLSGAPASERSAASSRPRASAPLPSKRWQAVMGAALVVALAGLGFWRLEARSARVLRASRPLTSTWRALPARPAPPATASSEPSAPAVITSRVAQSPASSASLRSTVAAARAASSGAAAPSSGPAAPPPPSNPRARFDLGANPYD